MARIVLSIEYDGSAYEGWQSQLHGRTVQDTLQTAIAEIAGISVASVDVSFEDVSAKA